MSHRKEKKDKVEKIRDLKVKNLCAQNIKAQNIETVDLKSVNTTTVELKAENIVLNGKSLACTLRNVNGEDIGSVLDPVDSEGKPIRKPNISEVVFNALLCNAQLELDGPDGLRERLEEGRQAIRDFEIENNCSTCGPTGPVEMEIYGYITRPLLNLKSCGVTGGTGSNAYYEEIQVLDTLNFHLEVDYDIKKVKSTQPRVVSVLCQMAFVDPAQVTGETGGTGICYIPQGNDCGFSVCKPIILEELFFGNKQFTPTLDRVYGENFNGVVNIHTDLAQLAVEAMPDINNCAAVQFVFYKEKGLEIWTNEESRGGGEKQPCINCPVDFKFTAFNGIQRLQDCRNANLWPCETAGGGPDSSGTDNCVTPIVASFTTSTTSGNAPLSVVFTDTSVFQIGGGAPQAAYEWSFGDGGTSRDTNPTYIYKQAGNYEVILKVFYRPGVTTCLGVSTTQATITVQ